MTKEAKLEDFTAKELETIQAAALRVWETIACDSLVDEQGRPDESMTMERATVIELVCDASRLEMELDDSKHPELAEKIRNSYGISALVAPAFPDEEYGY